MWRLRRQVRYRKCLWDLSMSFLRYASRKAYRNFFYKKQLQRHTTLEKRLHEWCAPITIAMGNSSRWHWVPDFLCHSDRKKNVGAYTRIQRNKDDAIYICTSLLKKEIVKDNTRKPKNLLTNCFVKNLHNVRTLTLTILTCSQLQHATCQSEFEQFLRLLNEAGR